MDLAQALNLIPSPLKAKRKAAKKVEPKVSISVVSHNMEIKTAETPEELSAAFRLRYEVFYNEMIGSNDLSGIDRDRFDSISDILIIKKLDDQKIIGTYRLIASCFSTDFYSATEFDLDGFVKTDGIKLELSRACIDKDHRNGRVISLLWRGIGEYARKVNAQYLFGCSSIWTEDPKEIANVTSYLAGKDALYKGEGITPLADYKVDIPEGEADAKLIPPLLKSYLRMGATVAPLPALDRAFKCFDYLTVLNLEKLNSMYERKYR